MKYLVTGGNGFVGGNLVRRLVDEGNEVWITSRTNDVGWRLKGVNIAGIFQFKKPEHFDYIYHLSAAGCQYGVDNDYTVIMANIIDTYALLTFFSSTNYKSFIYTDSSSSYGKKNKPMSEQDILEPDTIYAASKGSATLICQAYAKTYRKPIAIARLFSVYGQFEDSRRLIPTLIESAKTGKQVKLSDGVHDWIHIDDVVEALIRLREYADSRGEIYNIGTGVQTTNLQVAKFIETLLDKSIKYEEGHNLRSFDTNNWVADTKKVNKFWNPKLDIIQGLTKVIQYDSQTGKRKSQKNNN
jgi:nucleoside-diphosphate-sugar epimerase